MISAAAALHVGCAGFADAGAAITARVGDLHLERASLRLLGQVIAGTIRVVVIVGDGMPDHHEGILRQAVHLRHDLGAAHEAVGHHPGGRDAETLGGTPTSSVKRVLKVPRDEQPTSKQTSVTLMSPRRRSAMARSMRRVMR